MVILRIMSELVMFALANRRRVTTGTLLEG